MAAVEYEKRRAAVLKRLAEGTTPGPHMLGHRGVAPRLVFATRSETESSQNLIITTRMILSGDLLPLPDNGLRRIPGLPVAWLENALEHPNLAHVRMPLGWSKVAVSPGVIDVRDDFDEAVLTAVFDKSGGVVTGLTDVAVSTRPGDVPRSLSALHNTLEHYRQIEKQLRDDLEEIECIYDLRPDNTSVAERRAAMRQTHTSLKHDIDVLRNEEHKEVLRRGVELAALPEETFRSIEDLIGPYRESWIAFPWVKAAGKIIEHCERYYVSPDDLLDGDRHVDEAEAGDLVALNAGVARARLSLELSLRLERVVLASAEGLVAGQDTGRSPL